jgi:tetratricopeptide (TPR) repeat protein
MSRLLEVLGRAVAIDASELILNWLKIAHQSDTSSGDQQNNHLHKAIKLMGENKYDTAARLLRLYVFENPACIYGRLASAAIFLHNNQLSEAIKELKSVYLRHPNNTITLYMLGYCYERLGKEDQAIEFYQDCIKFKKYLQLPAQRLAAIYFKNKIIDKTICQYELLSSEYPEDISALITLGYLYLYACKYIQAAETFNKAILMYPDNFSADFSVEQLIEEGNTQDAIDYIEETLQNYPDRTDLIIKYGDILCMTGEIEQAGEQYQKLIYFSPDYLEGRIKLGMYYLKSGQDILAAEQFNKAFDINDNIVDAYIGLSIAYHLLKDHSKAIDTLNLASSIQNNSLLLFTETACLHYKTCSGLEDTSFNDHNDLINSVIEAHHQQILLSSHNPDLYYRFGILLMNYNRLSDAISAFENTLDINPYFSGALNKLAVCLSQSGNIDEAFYRLVKSISLDNDIVNLHYQTAILYYDLPKFASSIFNLENIFSNNYSSLETTQNISIILQNLAILDKSTVMWDNLLDTSNKAFDLNNQF